MRGKDIGGDVWGQANQVALTAAQRRRRARRNKTLFAHIHWHVLDLRLRETMIHAQANGHG